MDLFHYDDLKSSQHRFEHVSASPFTNSRFKEGNMDSSLNIPYTHPSTLNKGGTLKASYGKSELEHTFSVCVHNNTFDLWSAPLKENAKRKLRFIPLILVYVYLKQISPNIYHIEMFRTNRNTFIFYTL